MIKKPSAPVVIEFVTGSRVLKSGEAEARRELHTFIDFETGQRISLPADQVIHCEDGHGSARIGLGGMSFEGIEGEKLVFWRVRDLYPEEELHPNREMKLMVDTNRVASVHLQGTQVWPKRAQARGASEPEFHSS